MGFYVESADRPYESRFGSEDVEVGELVTEDGSDKYRLAEGSDNRIGAIATKPRSASYIADDEDDTNAFTYVAADNEIIPALPLVDGDLIKARTAEDPSGNESAPSISDGDVVGLIDTGAGTLTSTDEYHGRVVEEGYTDGEGTPTTYNRSNGNFLALGVAHKDSASAFDDVVRVRVQRENLQ